MDKKNLTTVRISKNIWFYMTFILWYGAEIFFQSTIEYINEVDIHQFEQPINIVVIIMLFTQIIVFQRYTKQQIVVLTCVSMIIIICTYTSGYNYIAAAWLFIVAAKDINYKMLIKLAYILLTIEIFMIVYLCSKGYINDVIMYRNGDIRHSFGFGHPNQLGMRIFQWILCGGIIFEETLNIPYLLVMIFSCYKMYQYTNCQTATICGSIFIILIFIHGLLRKRDAILVRKMENMMIYITAGIEIYSIFFTRFNIQRVPILKSLDKLISYRYFWAHAVCKKYGYTWFGQNFSVAAKENGIMLIRKRMYLDPAYSTLFLRFGIIMLILFCVAYHYLMKLYRDNSIFFIVLFIYSIYGFMENGLLQLTHNVFLLLFASLVYKKKEVMLRRDTEGDLKIHEKSIAPIKDF